jgi:CheY-like chemotaxis protein
MHKNDPAGKKILVVDDDTATRDALAQFLEGEGHTVAVAENGKEALDYLRHEPPPDLILLDLTMPVLGTYEFRQNQMFDPSLASIPVIVLSAAGDLPELADLLGDVGYVPKPWEGDVLVAAIHRFTVKQKPVVLVIDDESEIRKMLSMALRHCGFAVRLAATGNEAVDIYREHHHQIALLLLDVQMPGMDGPATLSALQKINPDLKACFMSGYTGRYSTKVLLDMGAAHVTMKPFMSLSLLTRLLWDMIGLSTTKNDGV